MAYCSLSYTLGFVKYAAETLITKPEEKDELGTVDNVSHISVASVDTGITADSNVV